MTILFVSVGTQAPFPRLIGYVSAMLASNPQLQAFAQVGPNGEVPFNAEGTQLIDERQFSSRIQSATVFVTHAGMGNIIRALELGVPAVVVPRKSQFGEHVNDHQVDTINEFSSLPGIFACDEQKEFDHCMQLALNQSRSPAADALTERKRLLDSVRFFLSQ